MALARTPVVLSFDLDGETLWTARDPKNENLPVTLSQGTYGPKRGAPRLMDLMDRHGIKVTFFVPGKTVERYPAVIKEIVARGHEIGAHGYHHIWPDQCTPEQDREEMERGIEAIRRVAGVDPLGYRSPAWEFGSLTMQLLVEKKMLYSTNFMDDDAPYIHPNGIVELPVQWYLDDAPFALYSARIPGRQIHPPSSVEEIWREEFLAMYEESKPLVLTMHPQLSGHAFRVRLLERLIRFMKGFPGVEFQTCAQIARRVREQGGWW